MEPIDDSPPDSTRSRPIWHWILAGAVYGVLVRFVFGLFSDPFLGPMSIGFLAGTPFVVGVITVYGFEKENRSILDAILQPWIGVVFMLLGCAITLLEGSICLAILSPFFLVCSSVGGLCMYIFRRVVSVKKSHLGAFALLPFAMLLGEGQMRLPDSYHEIRQTIVVHASAKDIWWQIMNARNIQANELPLSLVHLIGVPKPVEGVNVQTPGGEVRNSRWEHGVHFQALVTQRKENESITWHYHFDADSFPPGTMDEHVAIGGKYFDLGDTTFNLHPLSDNSTQLEIIAHYRVTSSINAYAVPVAALLGNDFVRTILTLYKTRSERAVHQLAGN